MGNSRLAVLSTFVPIMRGQLILYGCHWQILLFVMRVKGLAFFSFTRVKITEQKQKGNVKEPTDSTQLSMLLL